MLAALLSVTVLVVSIGLTAKKIKKDVLDSFCYSECIDGRHKMHRINMQQIF